MRTELAAALQAESAARRWQAIERLQTHAPKSSDETTLPVLVEALGDEHPFVRWQAGLALAGRRVGWQKLIDILRNKTATAGHEEKTIRMRSAAVDALATSASPDIEAVLIEVLRTGDALMRQSAAEALARQGKSEAVPALSEALQDDNPWVRRAAAYALGHIGDQRAVGVLIDKLADETVIVRRSATYALGALRATAAIFRLKVSLTDQDPQVRRNAAWALGRIGRPEAIPDLTCLLDDTALDGTIAVTAQQAINTLNKPRWRQLLLGWGPLKT
jgi:HEAT repeat protein